jgi:sugar lactone lactonase YvrE
MKLKQYLKRVFVLLVVISTLIFFTCPQVKNINGNTNESKSLKPSALGWIGGGGNGWKITNGSSSGTDYQSFNKTYKVFVDTSGNIYISDYMNHRVCKWDKDGNAIGWLGGGSDGWKTGSAPGSGGIDYKSFKNPKGVFVDSSGNIFVTDTANNFISKWDKDGNAIGWLGGGSDGWKTGSAPSNGTDYRSFYNPEDVFVDNSGYIFIVDGTNNRISKWNSSGTAIGWIGGGSDGWKTGAAPSSGLDYQSFNDPRGLYIDSSGNIIIAESINSRVSKWDKDGNAIGWLGGGSNGWKTGSAPSSGLDYQSFSSPHDVSLDSLGNILIIDGSKNSICKWDKDGNAIGWIGYGSNGWKTTTIVQSFLNDYQSFSSPYGLYVDISNNIYVSDFDNHRICKWEQ